MSYHDLAELGGSRRPRRQKNYFSASVTLDGLVVLNQRAPRSRSEEDIMEMKESDTVDTRNDRPVGHQLYPLYGEQQDVVHGNDRNLSNQRNITSEWQEHAKNHSNHSSSRSSAAGYFTQTTNGTVERLPAPSMNGRSTVDTSADTQSHLIGDSPKREAYRLGTKDPSKDSQPNGQQVPPNATRAPYRLGKREPPNDSMEVERMPADSNREPYRLGKRVEDRQVSPESNRAPYRLGKPEPPKDATPPQPNEHRLPADSNREPYRLGKRAEPLKGSQQRIPESASIATALLFESTQRKQENHQAEDSFGDGSATDLKPSSSGSLKVSDRTVPTDNRKMPPQKNKSTPKSFSPKVGLHLVVNQMSPPKTDKKNLSAPKTPTKVGFKKMNRMYSSSSSGDDYEEVAEPSLSTDDIFRPVLSSDDDDGSGLPSIPEIPVNSNRSIFDSQRGSAQSPTLNGSMANSSMANIDTRLTANSLRGVMKHTREIQSFYQPTTKIGEPVLDEMLQKELAELKAHVAGFRTLPHPWRYKSKKQREREKRRQEKKRAIRALASPARELYQPLSVSFPVLQQPETVFIRSREVAGAKRAEVEVMTGDKVPVATLSYTKLTPTDGRRKYVSGRRVLQDADGRICALIFHTQNSAGENKFRICGPVPMHTHHKSVDGYFIWAEIANVGELHPKFCMTIKRDADPQGQSVRFKTKTSGSRWLRCFGPEANGFSIYRKKDDGSKIGGCASISYYKDCRGLTVQPNMDFGLMLCFALVVDEMVAYRLR